MPINRYNAYRGYPPGGFQRLPKKERVPERGPEPLAPRNDFRPGRLKPRSLSVEPTQAQLNAVKTFRGLVANRGLAKYYRAAIGVDHPELKDDALQLFSNLPKITSANSRADLVAYGLWDGKPHGWHRMMDSPRYVKGRQVLVDAHVNPDAGNEKGFLSYQENGPLLRTYRASLVGEQGDDFLVQIDGRREPLVVPKTHIFELNQPHVYEGDVIDFRRDVHADYDSPLLKAKVAEAAIRIGPIVSQIDFRKPKEAEALQRRAVVALHEVKDMRYPKPGVDEKPGRSRDTDAGRQLVCGIGSCFKQGGVFLALMHPFLKLIGVDVEYVAGRTYTHLKANPGADPFKGGEHGWLQLTYRPTMNSYVADPTWRRLDQSMDEAYSRAGRRYPWMFVSTTKPAELKPTDVDLSSKAAIPARKRAFGIEGEAGREIHQEFEPDPD